MNFKYRLLSLITIFPTLYSHAGGVSLGATRVVYPADAIQSSLSIRNSSTNEPYLIQTWITDAKGEKSKDFIITPPLFVIKPTKENTLRIEMIGKPAWPVDREILYYLNSKSIPSTSPGENTINSLQIATQTVIKMFVRPKGLPISPDAAPSSLTCHYAGNNVQIVNPSPYYVSLVNLNTGKIHKGSALVAPKSQSTVNFKGPVSSLRFQSVNDYGAVSQVITCKS